MQDESDQSTTAVGPENGDTIPEWNTHCATTPGCQGLPLGRILKQHAHSLVRVVRVYKQMRTLAIDVFNGQFDWRHGGSPPL